MSYPLDPQCPECGEHYSAEVVQTYCHKCSLPLLAPGAPARLGLARDGWVRPDERVVLFNTGSGLKYLEG
jgi:threonine synthase